MKILFVKIPKNANIDVLNMEFDARCEIRSAVPGDSDYYFYLGDYFWDPYGREKNKSYEAPYNIFWLIANSRKYSFSFENYDVYPLKVDRAVSYIESPFSSSKFYLRKKPLSNYFACWKWGFINRSRNWTLT